MLRWNTYFRVIQPRNLFKNKDSVLWKDRYPQEQTWNRRDEQKKRARSIKDHRSLLLSRSRTQLRRAVCDYLMKDRRFPRIRSAYPTRDSPRDLRPTWDSKSRYRGPWYTVLEGADEREGDKRKGEYAVPPSDPTEVDVAPRRVCALRDGGRCDMGSIMGTVSRLGRDNGPPTGYLGTTTMTTMRRWTGCAYSRGNVRRHDLHIVFAVQSSLDFLPDLQQTASRGKRRDRWVSPCIHCRLNWHVQAVESMHDF